MQGHNDYGGHLSIYLSIFQFWYYIKLLFQLWLSSLTQCISNYHKIMNMQNTCWCISSDGAHLTMEKEAALQKRLSTKSLYQNLSNFGMFGCLLFRSMVPIDILHVIQSTVTDLEKAICSVILHCKLQTKYKSVRFFDKSFKYCDHSAYFSLIFFLQILK